MTASATMSKKNPIYTHENCLFAYQLHWELVISWRFKVSDSRWYESLRKRTLPTGIQISNHRFLQPGTSRFLVSTRPNLAPLALIDDIQELLQDIVRVELPHALHNTFRLRSLGILSRTALEELVDSDISHDKTSRERPLSQISQPIDLSHPQTCKRGSYSYNLQVVLESDPNVSPKPKSFQKMAHDEVLHISQANNVSLSCATIQPDHFDIVLGCPIELAPADVALKFMNTLAESCFRKPIFRFSVFTSTFGEKEWDEQLPID